MTTTQTLIVGSVVVLTSEAEREAYVAARTAEMAARWEAHVTEAMAAATDVPDYVPAEWSQQ